MKEEHKIRRIDCIKATDEYKKINKQNEKLNEQLNTTNYKLQKSSDQLGRLIDCVYQMNNPEYLFKLEEIVGEREI